MVADLEHKLVGLTARSNPVEGGTDPTTRNVGLASGKSVDVADLPDRERFPTGASWSQRLAPVDRSHPIAALRTE
jgi:hypothetical protein